MFYKYALEVSPSVMNATLMKAFNINATALGNLTACYFYAYLILQIPAGLLLDKFGPRRIATTAIFLCACGTLMFAKANSLFFAGIGRFLTGIGAAFAVVNCFKLISNWFPRKRFAFMSGLMMTVAMLGAVGGQAPLSAFIEAMDWRYAMNLIGGVGIALSLLFWLIVRDKSPNHKIEHHITPQKLSLLTTLRKILKCPQSWWLSVYSGFAFAPVMIFGGLWGVAFLSEAFHLNHNIAAQSVSMIFIGFAVGAPFFGWFSDFIKRRRLVMCWGTILALISISSVIYLPELSTFSLTFLLFFFGFSISSFLLCFTMIQEIHSSLFAATAIGFMNAFDAFFGAFSDPLTGKFLDLGWDGKLVDGARIFSVHNYKIAFITLPVYLVIALFSLIRIKETIPKNSNPSSLP